MRKSFVSLISSKKYQVGCTGQTVYVLDPAGNELAKFKDMIYAYYAALNPAGDVAAVYSNNGLMAIYSLSELRLIKKFRVSAVNGMQTDRVPCFSPDGQYLYHIESRKGDPLNSRLTVYSTVDYQPVLRLFEQGQKTVLNCIEFDKETGVLFLMGYFRRNSHLGYNDYFIAKLIDQSLQDVRIIDDHRVYSFYRSAVHLKQVGFTKDVYDASGFTHTYEIKGPDGKPIDLGPYNKTYTLDDLKQMDLSISRLWKDADRL